jgi:hypothetical protein
MVNTIKKEFQRIRKNITLFDIFFVGILSFIFLGFIVFFRRETTYITLRLKVSDPNVQFINVQPFDEFSYSFTQGDKEVNEFGQTVSEITAVNSYKTESSKQITYVDMKVKAVYNPRKKQYTVKGKPVAFGQSLAFILSKVKFEGLVVDFPGFRSPEEAKTETKIIRTQLRDPKRDYSDTYGVSQILAQAIEPGDEIKDSQGNVLVKVLTVDVSPAKRTIITNNNTSVTIFDQELKDVYYTLEVQAFNKNGRWYMFDYVPLQIGQILPLNFPYIGALPTILAIEDPPMPGDTK